MLQTQPEAMGYLPLPSLSLTRFSETQSLHTSSEKVLGEQTTVHPQAVAGSVAHFLIFAPLEWFMLFSESIVISALLSWLMPVHRSPLPIE